MASDDAGDDPSDCIEFDALPVIDLRMLSRSDLHALSIASNSSISDLSRLDGDLVVPEINRAVFNESAGSRKQTYSRLRLAPRNSEIGSCSSRSRPTFATSADDRVVEENREVIEALKELFDDGLPEPEPQEDLIPEQNAISESLPPKDVLLQKVVVGVEAPDVSKRIRKRGRPRNERIENSDLSGDQNQLK